MQDVSRLTNSVSPAELEHAVPNDVATVRALCLLAIVAFCLIVVAVFTTCLSTPHPTLFVLTLTISMLISFYIWMSLIELKLARRLMGLKSSLLIWAVFFGGMSQFAKVDAQVEINQIFHVDSALLPMTLAASTFMHALAKLEWIFYIICGVSFLFFGVYAKTNRKGKRTASHAICHLSNSLVFMIAASLVSHVMASKERRQEIIYRFAHIADFSHYSPCTNVSSDEFDVLYLDASRSKILIAPKVFSNSDFETNKPPILKFVPVPASFQVLTCKYNLRDES